MFRVKEKKINIIDLETGEKVFRPDIAQVGREAIRKAIELEGGVYEVEEMPESATVQDLNEYRSIRAIRMSEDS